MAGRDLLFDTNVIIDLFTGDKTASNLIQSQDFIKIPAIVVGELYYGAVNAKRNKERLKQIDAFLEVCHVIGIDQTTAKQYGMIKTDLRVKGKPIPDNDLWIAATCMQYNLQLVTRDKHFSYIDGLYLKKLVAEKLP